MSSFGAMTITDVGKQILSKFVAGEAPLTFSKLALGSGTTADDLDCSQLVDLIEWRQDVGIATVAHGENGEITIRGNYTNAGILTPYAARELGVYIQDPESGGDVLLGYFTDTLPDTVPAESIRAITDTIAITLVISGSENITAKFDTGQFATIQDVEDRRLTFPEVYPIGAIYISTVDTNPGELFAGTVWEALPAGRMLLGAGKADSGTVFKAGDVGGEEKHKLKETEMPAHTHRMSESNFTGTFRAWKFDPQGTGVFSSTYIGGGANSRDGGGDAMYRVSFNGRHSHKIETAGTGVAHNNMPPYIVVYMWRRIA